MAVIAVRGVRKSLGGEIVLDDATFEVNERDRVGVVGPNGSGKSTLFRLILGVEEPDAGEVSRSRSARLGHLAQHNVFEGDHDVITETMTAFSDLFATERRMRELEERMAGESDEGALERLVNRHAALQEEFDRADGYAAHARAEATLEGLGVGQDMFTRPVKHLSGGEAGRVALAKLLLSEPDVLLLDEPTNHLDIEGCEWLEDYLIRFGGACLVISHDRFFLERTTDRTLEVEAAEARLYKGVFSRYEKMKTEELEAARRAFTDQQKHIRKEREFIKRHMGTQRTREAKGRLRRLERLEKLASPDRADDELRLVLAPRKRLGTEVVHVDGVSLAYGDRQLFRALELRVGAGDRLGIVGANGTGKSTLLEILLGRKPADEGAVHLGPTVDHGYFDQLHADLPPDSTPYEEIATVDLHMSDFQIKSWLARFLFWEEEVQRPIRALSGGERSRLALAKLILRRPNVLVLDEPTNHLDIGSRQALEGALDEFEGGTIITVSHDRFFLDRICTHVLWLDADSATLYHGNYSAAREKRLALAAAREQADQEAREREKARARRKAPAPAAPSTRPRRRALEKVEAELEAAEEERESILAAMAEERVYMDPDALRDHKARLLDVETRLAELEREWESFDDGTPL